MPSAFAQLTASSSEFLNKRGIYLGRRSTKLHVALYRRSGGRIGGHIPGWPEARLLLLDHTGEMRAVAAEDRERVLELGAREDAREPAHELRRLRAPTIAEPDRASQTRLLRCKLARRALPDRI